MRDAFLRYADKILPRRRERAPARSERQAPTMVLKGAEKALAERDQQFRRGKRWTKAQLKELLEGPWSAQIRKLIAFLHKMQIEDGPLLLALLDELDYFQTADRNLRFHILAEIDDAIMMLRICNGLSPIDDALPGESLTIFQRVKERFDPELVNHVWST